MQTLYLEKMGCDFFKGETAESDIKNYRVRTHGKVIPGKDGNMYFLEFTLWRDRTKARNTHKITRKPLKHTHYDIINRQALGIDTQYTDIDGLSWRNSELERALYGHNYSFNTSDILKVVNEISTEQYNKVIFADAAAIACIPDILKIAGWREKNILDNLTEVTTERADKNYLVYRFHANNNYFDYEVKSGRIMM